MNNDPDRAAAHTSLPKFNDVKERKNLSGSEATPP